MASRVSRCELCNFKAPKGKSFCSPICEANYYKLIGILYDPKATKKDTKEEQE